MNELQNNFDLNYSKENGFESNYVEESLWKRKITQVEGNYLAKIFSFTFLIFVGLGLLVMIMAAEMSFSILSEPSSAFASYWWILLIIIFPLGIGMFLIRWWWNRKILATSWFTIGLNYAFSLLFYVCIFAVLITVLNFLNFGTNKEALAANQNLRADLYSSSVGYVLLSFGVSSGIFLILASITWFSTKAAMSLRKAVIIAVLISSVLLIALLMAGIFGLNKSSGSGSAFSVIFIVFLVVFGLISIFSTISSLYTIKKSFEFVDFEDKVTLKKWKAWHCFEILECLLRLSFLVLKVIVLFFLLFARRED